MKSLLIVVPSSGASHDIDIKPGTTARDILEELNMSTFRLQFENGGDALGNDESVYDKVLEGQKLVAVSNSEVADLCF